MSAARTLAAGLISLTAVGVVGAAVILLARQVGIEWALLITVVWLGFIGFALALGKVGGNADRTAERLHQQRREEGR